MADKHPPTGHLPGQLHVQTTPYETLVRLPADLRRLHLGCGSSLALTVLFSVLFPTGGMSALATLGIFGMGAAVTLMLFGPLLQGLGQLVNRSRWGHPVLFGLALGWSALGAAPGGLNSVDKILAWLFVAVLFYGVFAWSMGHVHRLQLDGRALIMRRARTHRAMSKKGRVQQRVIPLESISSVEIRRFPWWPVARHQVVLEVEGEGTVPVWSGPLRQEDAERLVAHVRHQMTGQQRILQKEGHDLSTPPHIPAALRALSGEKPPG